MKTINLVDIRISSNQVHDQVSGQVQNQVREQVLTQVWHQVRNQVWVQVWYSFRKTQEPP